MYHFGAAPSLQGQSDEKEFEKIPWEFILGQNQ
jgi:hypothetical protein